MQDGDTPLTGASREGNLNTVEVLLAHKGDVNAKNNVSRQQGVRGRYSTAVRRATHCLSMHRV